MRLDFEKTNEPPKVGMFVALHNCFPVEMLGHIGLIIKIDKHPLGFNYSVFDFANNKVYEHHISSIIPLKTRIDFEIEE